jgi:hypothetical protein
MPIPEHPKIYHILHLDRLKSVIAEGLLSDEQISVRDDAGTMIGMSSIKRRRLCELALEKPPRSACGSMCAILFLPSFSNAIPDI